MKHLKILLTALASAAMWSPTAFAVGADIGKGTIPSSANELFTYCDSAESILLEARDLALTQFEHGDLTGARASFVDGLVSAETRHYQESYAPLTQNAISRGIEIDSVFSGGCKRDDQTCLKLEQEVAINFFNQYYRYIVETVAPLDKTYYVPFIAHYRHHLRYNRDEHHHYRRHDNSDDSDGNGDGDSDGNGDGRTRYGDAKPDFDDGYASSGEDYAEYIANLDNHGCESFECLPGDWGNEFRTAYAKAAKALLEFYIGKNHNGFPNAFARDGYELHFLEKILDWAGQDLNEDLSRRSFPCLVSDLFRWQKRIANFNNQSRTYFLDAPEAERKGLRFVTNAVYRLEEFQGCEADHDRRIDFR